MVAILLSLSALAAILSAWWWIASARIDLPALPPKLTAPVTGPDGRPLGPVSMFDEAARLDRIIRAVDQIAHASRSAAILNRKAAFAAAAAAILAALSLLPPML